MLKNKKFQRGKGKRIKDQWQFRLLNLIGDAINFPEKVKRRIKYYQLSFERMKAQRKENRKQKAILDEQTSARIKSFVIDRYFNQHVYDCNKCEYGLHPPCGRPARYRSDSIPHGYYSCELHVPMMMDDRLSSDQATIRVWALENPELANQFYPGNKFNKNKPP